MPLRFAFLLLLLCTSQADAAALYKCAGPKQDDVSIQSAPCAAGSKQVWVRDGTPEPPLTDAQMRAREQKRQQDAEAAQSLSRMAGTEKKPGGMVVRNQNETADTTKRCVAAKEQVQAIRDRDWRTLTVDRLREMDAWVEAECKNK